MNELRLTVLGSSGSVPRPGRACSAYMVEGNGVSILLDMGTGALANLRHFSDYDQLDAVVISHMHADHFLDVIPLRYALKYGRLRPKGRVPLYLPVGGEQMLRTIVSTFASEGPADFLSEVFDVRTYGPEEEVRIGDARLTFTATQHYIPSFAVRVGLDGSSMTYSADTAPDDRVVRLADGCNLFLCEASLLPGETEGGSVRGHSSAAEAATMAQRAGVERLVLTHYSSDTTPDQLLFEAKKSFDGAIRIADDNILIE